MVYYGVFIPGKTNFEGSVESCPGSVAAANYNPLMVQTSVSGSPIQCDEQLLKEDPEYPVDSPDWLVFLEKAKALDLLRQYKEARLREFANLEQAERYVQFGFESVQSMKLFAKVKCSSSPSSSSSSSHSNSAGTNAGGGGHTTQIKSGNNNQTNSSTSGGGSSLSASSAPTTTNGGTTPSTETVSLVTSERPPFRAPTKQELVEFRKTIESGDCNRVRCYVWENPRYLISCGDTPTNLKEGYRYNSIHICAQFNQAKIAEMLLKVVADRRFAYLYTGKRANPTMCAALNKNLLDYYLNMPDKGRSETPLHFASKNGYWEVVAVLVSYPECKSLPNKDGQLPKDIICQRARLSDPEVCDKIKLLLTERFYVPVLRAVDQTFPPKVGQPFSSNNPPHALVKDEVNDDPFSPNYKIKALAGPMNKDQADKFCRRWKTPPRHAGGGNTMGTNPSSPAIVNNAYISPLKSPYAMYSSPMHKSMMYKKPQRRRVLFSPNLPEKQQQQQQRIVETIDELTEVFTIRNGVGEEDLDHADNHHNRHHVAKMLNGAHSEHFTADLQNCNHNKFQEEHQTQQGQLNAATENVDRQQLQPQPEPESSEPTMMDITYEIETNNNDTNTIEQHSSTPVSRPTIAVAAATTTTTLTINSQTHYEKYGTIAFPYTPSKLKYRDIQSTSLANDSITINYQCNESLTMSPSLINDSFIERHIKNTDFEKGLESIGRQLAKQENINWSEYWDFLDEFVDITQPIGLDKLEQYFVQRFMEIDSQKKTNVASPFNELCIALAKAGLVDCNKSSSSSSSSSKSGNSNNSNNNNNSLGFLATTNNSSTKHHQIGTSHWAQLCSNFTASNTTTENGILANSIKPADVLQFIANPIPQVNTPYTCVEKSLQVFAKRMTKTIINNINNVVSINDTLLSELKRLKSLISSFKEDTRFYSVDFSKVHSRIGNLVATYIENSNEVMLAIKLKIQSVLRDLLVIRRERREHLECVCSYMLQMLEQSSNQLPHNLKTEELCSIAWATEQSCDCQWDGNLTRKTSRRKRTEASLYASQQQKQHESKDNLELTKNLNSNIITSSSSIAGGGDGDISGGNGSAPMSVVLPIARSHLQNNHLINNMGEGAGNHISNDDNIWWDCGAATESSSDSDDDNDDDDCFQTPPETPSPSIEEESYKLYVMGDVPTKRDLDVLNALSNVELDRDRYPFICAWKTAVTGFTVEEMHLFPSPIKSMSKENAKGGEQNETPVNAGTQVETKKDEAGRLKSAFESTLLGQIAGKGKRLFSTPKLNAAVVNLRTEAVANAAIEAIKATAATTAAAVTAAAEAAATTATAAAGAAATTATAPPAAATSTVTSTATPTTTTTTHNRFGPFNYTTPLFKMRGLFSQYRESSKNDDDEEDDDKSGIGDGPNDSFLLHN